jgi:hypothetical protein
LAEVLDSASYPLLFPGHDTALLTQASLRMLRDRPAAATLVVSARARLGQVASANAYADRVCGLLETGGNLRRLEGNRP